MMMWRSEAEDDDVEEMEKSEEKVRRGMRRRRMSKSDA